LCPSLDTKDSGSPAATSYPVWQ